METLLKDQRENSRSLAGSASSSSSRNVKYITRSDCVPEFVPDNPNMSITRWIFKIDQLGEVHGWDEVEKIYHMQNGLRGLAKNWYDSLTNINYSWDEWKQILRKAFPEYNDYAASLRKLLGRTKYPNETMATYYYNKIELLQVCNITGRDAVSCVIDGLRDVVLQNGARAGRYENPESLYEEYLSRITEEKSEYKVKFEKRKYEAISNVDHYERRKVHRWERPYTSGTRQVKCFNCSRIGHISTKCPQPRKSCENCHRLGHVTADCKNNKVLLMTDSTENNKMYFVDCKVNDQPSRGYIDSGSAAVTIKEDVANTLLLKTIPSTAVISGFGGGATTVIGKANIELEVNNVKIRVDAFVVSDHLQTVPIIIGQPYVNHPDVTVIIRGDELHILPADKMTLPMIEEKQPRKVAVRAKEETVIPPRHIAYMEVTTTDSLVESSIYVEATHRDYENKSYSIPRCIINGKMGVLPIVNLGHSEVSYRKGQVVARAEECYEQQTTEETVSINLTTKTSYQPFILNELNMTSDTPENIKKRLLELINQYRDCFSQNFRELGKTNLVKMSINLTDNKPIVYRPYRSAYSERAKIRELVEELKENEIIRDSNSPFASPVLLVKKRTGDERLCIDYRALNKITEKNKFPLPRVEDQLDNLCGANYFTSLDMASGYYQIGMDETAINKTAFVTPDGHYEFLRMPFGLVNAPAIFQNLVNQVLGHLRFTTALAYMDDILLPTVDYEAGLKTLEDVLKLFRKANLTLRLSKCYFFQNKIDYLGHEISKDGVKPGSTKILAVQKFKKPQNVREVRQFIGLTSYFRKFIKGFAEIAKPLTMLTRKGSDFVWGIEQNQAFNTLKDKLVERPLLALYDICAETEVHTDASKLGVGGILLQLQKNKQWQPVAYFSRQTTNEEQRYHSYELETLAVVQSLQRFRVYLIGKEFRVVTDCNAIRTTFTKRDLLPRIGRWWLAVQEFDFTVVYRAGSKMSHVDALSRNPVENAVKFSEIDLLTVNVTEDDWVIAAQLQDTRIKYLHEVLSRDPKVREEKDIHDQFTLKNNRVFKKTDDGLRWVSPKTARRQLTMLSHDQIGHFSHEKTLNLMKRSYWFPAMRQYVKRYISTCLGCMYNKVPAGKRPGYLHPIEKVSEPMHTVHIDHLGPFVKSKRKNAYLIVGVDSFTKYVFMKAVPNTKEIHVEKFLDEKLMTVFGVPKRIIADRGTCFTSKRFKTFCIDLGIKLILNATATPRANGQVERYNRTILASLAATYSDEERWDKEICKVTWGLNTTINKATGKSPCELLFGYVPRSVNDAFLLNEIETDQYDRKLNETRHDVGKRLLSNQIREKSRFDGKRCTPKTFQEGQLVLVRKISTNNEGSSKKLRPKYEGPFLIQRVLRNDRYVVADPEGSTRSQRGYTGIVSVDKLKHFKVVESDTSDDSSQCSDDSN